MSAYRHLSQLFYSSYPTDPNLDRINSISRKFETVSGRAPPAPPAPAPRRIPGGAAAAAPAVLLQRLLPAGLRGQAVS